MCTKNSEDFKEPLIKLLESENELKLLSKHIKNDNAFGDKDIVIEGCIIPKKLKSTDFIVCLYHDNKIISFIWFGLYSNNIYISANSKKYLHVNYSYTFKKYRNNGFNKKLRLWIESYCYENNIRYIVSVPLPVSNSNFILEKMNYSKINHDGMNPYYIKELL